MFYILVRMRSTCGYLYLWSVVSMTLVPDNLITYVNIHTARLAPWPLSFGHLPKLIYLHEPTKKKKTEEQSSRSSREPETQRPLSESSSGNRIVNK